MEPSPADLSGPSTALYTDSDPLLSLSLSLSLCLGGTERQNICTCRPHLQRGGRVSSASSGGLFFVFCSRRRTVALTCSTQAEMNHVDTEDLKCHRQTHEHRRIS